MLATHLPTVGQPALEVAISLVFECMPLGAGAVHCGWPVGAEAVEMTGDPECSPHQAHWLDAGWQLLRGIVHITV